MTICGSQACGCGIISNSLTVTGSGAPGSPFQLETNQGAIVTSSTRPGSPIHGTQIYETDTQRLLVYDGTNWVIVGGDWPRFKVEQTTAQSIPDTTATTVTLGTEVYDQGGYHTSTNGFVTVPSTLGGDYLMIAAGFWTNNATGYRTVQMVVSSNAGAPTQIATRRVGGAAMINTSNNGLGSPMIFRLVAGAIVTVQAIQTSGGALNLNSCAFEGIMLRHIPSLV